MSTIAKTSLTKVGPSSLGDGGCMYVRVPWKVRTEEDFCLGCESSSLGNFIYLFINDCWLKIRFFKVFFSLFLKNNFY